MPPTLQRPMFRGRLATDDRDPTAQQRADVFRPCVWHSVTVHINPGGWMCYFVDGVPMSCTGLTVSERTAFRRVLEGMTPATHIGMVPKPGWHEGDWKFRNLFARWRTGLLIPKYIRDRPAVVLTQEEEAALFADADWF